MVHLAPGSDKNELAKVSPKLKNEFNRLVHERKRIGYPFVMITNPEANEMLAYGLDMYGLGASKVFKKVKEELEQQKYTSASDLEEEVEHSFQSWVNREGKLIEAKALRIEDKVVYLELKSGKIAKYPIKNLSDEGQDQLKNLFP